MTERLAILSDDVEDASAVVDTLRMKNYQDDDIYVITRHEIWCVDELPDRHQRAQFQVGGVSTGD